MYLYPELGMEAGLSLMAAVDIADGTEKQLAAIYRVMVDSGVADWTFINEEGDKLPINPAMIRGALPWMRGGSEVARAAIRQYGDIVTAPFEARTKIPTSKSSRRGRTNGTSTSAKRASSSKSRVPSG